MDAGSAPMPLNKQRFTIAHGWNVSAFKAGDADTVQRASQFILWLTAPGFSVQYLTKSDNVPASKGQLRAQGLPGVPQGQGRVMRPFNEQAADRLPRPHHAVRRQVAGRPSAPRSRRRSLTRLGINDAIAEGQRNAQLILDEDHAELGGGK